MLGFICGALVDAIVLLCFILIEVVLVWLSFIFYVIPPIRYFFGDRVYAVKKAINLFLDIVFILGRKDNA